MIASVESKKQSEYLMTFSIVDFGSVLTIIYRSYHKRICCVSLRYTYDGALTNMENLQAVAGFAVLAIPSISCCIIPPVCGSIRIITHRLSTFELYKRNPRGSA